MNPNLIKSLWAVALAIGLSIGGTALIKANKVTTTSVERTPMPVAATVYSQQPTFTRNANYLGVIKAGSDSVLGFEVAGVLTGLPATEAEANGQSDCPQGLNQIRVQNRGLRMSYWGYYGV